MSNSIKNQRGVALVVTLAIIAILLTTATQVSKIANDAVGKSIQQKEQFFARQKALSGIHLAALILVEDAQKNGIDSIQENWADPQWLEQTINQLGYEQGSLTITIEDELSKLQINALLQSFPGNELNPGQVRIWEHFFKMITSGDDITEQKDPAQFINPIKDWMDSEDDDAITGISGAESEYYEGLDPAYSVTNEPFNHINELFSVKGISLDLLSQLGEQQEDPDQLDLEQQDQNLQDQVLSEFAEPVLEKQKQLAVEDQLAQMLTVFGVDDAFLHQTKYRYHGRVNINTAPLMVLQALLPEGMEELAQDLADFREQKGEQGLDFINTLDKGWYKRVIDLSDKEKKKFEQTIGYASNVFRVECTAVQNSEQITLVAFLKRQKHGISGKWNCRTLRMERKD